MNPKKLVYVDVLLSPVFSLVALFFRCVSKFRAYFMDSNGSVLIVKFLGAGNFVSCSKLSLDSRFTILTVKNNVATLKIFAPNAKYLVINDKNVLFVFFTICLVFFRLFFSKYEKVINLESESSFAKLASAIPVCKSLHGVSNRFKGIFDLLFYDFHLVSPSLLSRPKLLEQLISYNPTQNPDFWKIVSRHNQDVLKQVSFLSKSSRQVLLLAPSCSKTDENRRLTFNSWCELTVFFSEYFGRLVVVFPSTDDPQYQDFKSLASRIKNLDVLVADYEKFVTCIKESDLVVTVDSQALHIAQRFGKPTVAFYGPTSPFGVEISPKTIIVSRAFVCSPCTHKYLKIPCQGKNSCMEFEVEGLIKFLSSLF